MKWSPVLLTIREFEIIFVRCDGATTKKIFVLLVRLYFGNIEAFIIVVVRILLVINVVGVVNIESNIVSCTRRVNGNSPRLQNKPV